MQGDCFIEMQDGEKQQANEDLCINPYMSVSIACNGDVLSCCYIFEPSQTEANVYGNLNHASLSDIWNGRQANDMRDKTQKGCPEGACTKCYLKSPSRIHMNILSRLLRWQKSQTLELEKIRKERSQ
jgi:radical SAM protein with 4Fe4S-binding SPASM domain